MPLLHPDVGVVSHTSTGIVVMTRLIQDLAAAARVLRRSRAAFPHPPPPTPMHIRFLPTLLALALTTLAAADATAQTGQALAERLDSIAGSAVLANRAVGTAAAVVMGNDTLLMEGYGKAVVEWDVPMPADAMFEIGSAAKQFTAAAILQLRDEGKLSLDDEITKWLPDVDTRGNRVTVRRLLDHTSGMVGLTEMPEIQQVVWNPSFPRDSVIVLINRYPFQFPTGTMQVYNNSAFWLAGLIIEKVSGMTYADYVEQRIFAPLGMTRSMYCDSGENVPRRAHGYMVYNNGVINRGPRNAHTWMPFAAGSICSTAGDLLTWVQALHGGEVLSPGSYQEMITPGKLNDGTPLRYGLGIAVQEDVHGLPYIGHGGSVGGFDADTRWYPDAQLAVVVLMNNGGNSGDVAGRLAAELLPWQRPTVAAFTGDAAPLVGTYRGPGRGPDFVFQVTQAPQGIAVSINGSSPSPAPWIEGMTFRIRDDAFVTFRGGDLHLSGGATVYSVLKRQ
jgi:CubicO group peptidase (beta-lactamase class C family)